MELTQLNNTSMNYVSSSTKNTVVQKTDNTISDVVNLKSDIIESNLEVGKSNLGDRLSSNISILSDVSVAKSNINSQLEIINKIQTTVEQAQISNNNFEALDIVQPQVESMMINYNEISKITSKQQISEDDHKSTAFFDGVLGSKPLNPSEIFKAIETQREILSQSKDNLTSRVKEIAVDSINSIKNERAVSQANSPFKESDFVQNSINFESKVIREIPGSVIDVQTSISNDTSVRLLS
jgi:hypothetical protein